MCREEGRGPQVDLPQLPQSLLTFLFPVEAKAIATDQPSDNSTVTTETEEGQNTTTTSR